MAICQDSEFDISWLLLSVDKNARTTLLEFDRKKAKGFNNTSSGQHWKWLLVLGTLPISPALQVSGISLTLH